METTAYHTQFCIRLSLITKRVPQQYLLRSMPATAPETTPRFTTNSFWHGTSARMSAAHPAPSLPNQLSTFSDLRNTNKCTCWKRLSSTGRDRCVVLAPTVAGFNGNIMLETDTSADRLTVEKTERREEESERMLSDAQNEILLRVSYITLYYRSIFDKDRRLTKCFLICQNVICLSSRYSKVFLLSYSYEVRRIHDKYPGFYVFANYYTVLVKYSPAERRIEQGSMFAILVSKAAKEKPAATHREQPTAWLTDEIKLFWVSCRGWLSRFPCHPHIDGKAMGWGQVQRRRPSSSKQTCFQTPPHCVLFGGCDLLDLKSYLLTMANKP